MWNIFSVRTQPRVDSSHVTRKALEFGRYVLDQAPGAAWPNSVGQTRKMQENYYETLSVRSTLLRRPS